MRRKFRRFRHQPADTEINITAFLNLMVILVPFLLLTAVFSRLSVHDLFMPSSETASTAPAKPGFSLQLYLQQDKLVLNESKSRKRVSYELGAADFDVKLKQLNQELYQLKQRYPQELDATLMVHAEVSYERLIAVMDHIRMALSLEGEQKKAELFPNIAIGELTAGMRY